MGQGPSYGRASALQSGSERPISYNIPFLTRRLFWSPLVAMLDFAGGEQVLPLLLGWYFLRRQGQARTGQIRTGQVRTGQVRTGRSSQDISSQDRRSQERRGQDRLSQDMSSQVRSGLFRTGQVRKV